MVPQKVIIPFHQWKQEEIARLGGWLNACRPREYYWKAYGGYCNKMRQQAREAV